MSLTVYGAPLSPFVRKLCLCLIEKGLDYELEVVMPFGQPDWFRELNPLGRIPAFRDGDLKLADSSVICQYLEEHYPEHKPLYGADAEQRAPDAHEHEHEWSGEIRGVEGEARNQRALEVVRRIQNKLTGRDYDPTTPLSVPEQVDRLIQDATSVENLCVAFIG